jgi:hypothetical protein
MLIAPPIDFLIHVADECVETPVPIVNNVLAVVEVHMLHAIKIVEDAGEHTLPETVHQRVKDLDALAENRLA